MLAKELDHYKDVASKKGSAFEKANEQAQKYQHLSAEVTTLKETAEVMKLKCSQYQEENRALKQKVTV